MISTFFHRQSFASPLAKNPRMQQDFPSEKSPFSINYHGRKMSLFIIKNLWLNTPWWIQFLLPQRPSLNLQTHLLFPPAIANAQEEKSSVSWHWKRRICTMDGISFFFLLHSQGTESIYKQMSSATISAACSTRYVHFPLSLSWFLIQIHFMNTYWKKGCSYIADNLPLAC